MAEKFLIIRFSSIGDILQCMGIIGGIKKQFPQATIHWIARKDMASFLAMDQRIDKVWSFDRATGLKGLLQMAKELQKEHYDYIYDAHRNIRSAILRYKLLPLSGQKPHFVYRSKERWKRFLLFRFDINRFPWPFRGMESYRKPLAPWGITDFKEIYTDWHFPESYASKWNAYLSPRTVTLVPSANWEMKRWPVSHWQKLIQILPDYQFLVLGGAADTFCKDIQAVAPARVHNLAGQTSLLESCYIVRQSPVVISADTGFMHAADLFHTPVLALIGPTAFGFPSGPSATVFSVDLPCRPCTKDGSGKCKRCVYQECMIRITPESVASYIKQTLPLSSPDLP